MKTVKLSHASHLHQWASVAPDFHSFKCCGSTGCIMYERLAVRGGSDQVASDTAAFSGRRQVALSEDELARLGLDDCKDEAPEYAKLFWGVEELENVGGGKYYPKR